MLELWYSAVSKSPADSPVSKATTYANLNEVLRLFHKSRKTMADFVGDTKDQSVRLFSGYMWAELNHYHVAGSKTISRSLGILAYSVSGRAQFDLYDGDGNLVGITDNRIAHADRVLMASLLYKFLQLAGNPDSVTVERSESPVVDDKKSVPLTNGSKGTVFKVLPISQVRKKYIESPTSSDADASPQITRSVAEHIVRAQRRYYGPEKPLFGKYVGWVEIKSHKRGDPKNGKVVKEYRLEST